MPVRPFPAVEKYPSHLPVCEVIVWLRFGTKAYLKDAKKRRFPGRFLAFGTGDGRNGVIGYGRQNSI